ncbi:alanyl-tRNA editing protein [Rhodovulum sp. DZ06]|uniref:alanyl-tRNA editing protein n=1 Tax=Rhodovulum sp. DZ06 TaxID=3425126 RepID=UPI003D3345C9
MTGETTAMATQPLFREDAYLKEAAAVVTALTPEGGIVLDRSIFYPAGGGQPGDRGRLDWEGGGCDVATTVKGGEVDGNVLVPAEGSALPEVGTAVRQSLDWAFRWGCMRIHTGLHLLSVAIPLPVTGGQIGPEKGRLDFDMPDAPDKEAVQAALDALVAGDHVVSEEWITDEELDANPGLVKTMSVQPPRGSGRIRLVRIGSGDATVDLQPCGGTHVRRTGEIGALRVGKVEKKGKQNRRVAIHLG